MQARPLGALAAAVLAAAGVAVAAPAQASSGVFVYTEPGTVLLNALVAPPDRDCIVLKGDGARNFTTTDVVLYYDTTCHGYLLALVPGESLPMPFESIQFVPGAGAPRPRRGDTASPSVRVGRHDTASPSVRVGQLR